MAARRQIIKPPPAPKAVNHERIERLTALLDSEQDRYRRWQTKLKRAMNVMIDADKKIGRLCKAIDKEKHP
jgi:hypothetical protein